MAHCLGMHHGSPPEDSLAASYVKCCHNPLMTLGVYLVL
jgi:hypothetical protein